MFAAVVDEPVESESGLPVWGCSHWFQLTRSDHVIFCLYYHLKTVTERLQRHIASQLLLTWSGGRHAESGHKKGFVSDPSKKMSCGQEWVS